MNLLAKSITCVYFALVMAIGVVVHGPYNYTCHEPWTPCEAATYNEQKCKALFYEEYE